MLEFEFEEEPKLENKKSIKSLFEISQDFRSLYDMANDIESEDMDALGELFKEVETSLADKLDNTSYVIKELNADAETLKSEAKRLTDKAKTLENKGKYLKELMLGAIKASGVEKLKSDKFSYYIKRTEVLNVVSEDNIPRQFMKITKAPMKDDLKTYIKEQMTLLGIEKEDEDIDSGSIIDGVSIVENESLISR